MLSRMRNYTKSLLMVFVSLLMLTTLLVLSPRPAQAGWSASPQQEGVKPSMPEQSLTFKVESLSSGDGHTCAIRNDGSVTCWGNNEDGQSTPPDRGTFIQISAGFFNTCGLMSDGTLACWGNDNFGKSSPPTGTFTQVSTGENHTCGLKSDGTLTCWGENLVGQLNSPSGTFTQVSAGTDHSCALKSDGTLVCWGLNNYGQATPPAGTFSQITAGGNHTCGIKSDGTATCWGYNIFGQATPPAEGTYLQISASWYHTCGLKSDGTITCWGDDTYDELTPPSGAFSQISAGGYHTCGVKSDGTLACWGYDEYEQSTPPTGEHFLRVQISAGGTQTCELKSDGSVVCWGGNEDGESTPPAGTFTQISAGSQHTCGIKSDGTLACWGNDDYNQSTPPAGTFTQVSAGGFHNCGLKSNGTLACWGWNEEGQASPPAGTFTQVSSGVFNTCGIKSDGTLACWGWDGFGQSTPPTGTFTQVSPGGSHTCGLKNNGTLDCWGEDTYEESSPPAGTFSQISSGAFHTCGLQSDGSLECWGLNTDGQTTAPEGTFTQVNAGVFHTCALKNDGSLTCWGFNDNDQSFPYSISGHVGVAGATLSFSDGSDKTTTSNFDGSYSLSVSYNWSGSVTPTITGHTFSPTSKSYSDVLSDQTNQDYTFNNLAPIANASTDQSVNTMASVNLNGSGSSDPDGDTPLTYQWTQIEGPTVTLSSATAANPSFTAPSDPTNLIFNLVVTDSFALESGPDEVVIFVNNQAPIANASSDQSVNTMALVNLNGSGSSDPDGDTPLSYEWTQLEGIPVTLSNETVANPTFTAPSDPTTLLFSLIVSDSLGMASTADDVVVTVNNQAPSANASTDQSVDTMSFVSLNGSGSSDPDGDTPLTYQWTQLEGLPVTLSSQTVANPTFTAPSDPTTLLFSLIVTDDLGMASTADDVVITVNNQAPIAEADQNQSIDTLTFVSLNGSGSSDPDGDFPLTYEWTQLEGQPVTLSSQTVANPSFTAPSDPTTLLFSLIVTDDLGMSSTADEVIIFVNNQAPIADAGQNQFVEPLAQVTLDASGSSDPDGDTPFTYLWTQIEGPTVTLDNPNAINPTFTAPVTSTTLVFSLVVTDNLGLPSDEDLVLVIVGGYRVMLPLIVK